MEMYEKVQSYGSKQLFAKGVAEKPYRARHTLGILMI